MTRTLDALLKLDELQSLLGSGDADKLHDAARRGQVALGFRATDAMLGLEPVGEDVLERLGAAVRAALREATALGVHDAACELARMHMADGDLAGAFAVVVAAAEAGHCPGVELAAHIAGRTRDPQRAAQALAWLQAARERDEHGRMHFMLGLFACQGVGGEVDVARGFAYHTEAAARGDADAMFELYVMHARGLGCPADEAVALAWCRKAAEGGNVRAMGNLGGFYATGSGVERDPARAVEWYERAAQLGHGRSAATLGTMYATGDGVAVAPEQARLWFRAADDLGFDWRDMAEAVGLDVEAWDDAFAEPMGLD
ncbi:tetratricopeptide repeat protein [Nannocystis sp. SCPEA4]|uniref:tetratricopeptide repeat protein n=1 Tax=Nannocystis sp. SCPEA4 TaxID=2996787 RepID=UPI00226DD248|nr:tetratricopeptide repeat protein [Nannocystis sp. SCPEA4]MCY1058783.1 tetratricopeptide repeat protein [Nannocystis sp. SCPEA4]